MKNERGYICIATFTDAVGEFWFGQKTNPGLSKLNSSERFNTNGLRPYNTIREAEAARAEIQEKLGSTKTPDIARIELKIAETQEDLDSMNKARKLVVVADTTIGKELFGRFTESAPRIGYIPVSSIETNGRQSFRSFSQAEYAAQEIRRQRQMKATIARLKIKSVEPVNLLKG